MSANTACNHAKLYDFSRDFSTHTNSLYSMHAKGYHFNSCAFPCNSPEDLQAVAVLASIAVHYQRLVFVGMVLPC